jgi:hypothetical protein
VVRRGGTRNEMLCLFQWNRLPIDDERFDYARLPLRGSCRRRRLKECRR